MAPVPSLSNNLFILSYAVRTNDPNLIVIPQVTTNILDPMSWTSNGISTSVLFPTNINGTSYQQRSSSILTNGSMKQFMRIKVQYP